MRARRNRARIGFGGKCPPETKTKEVASKIKDGPWAGRGADVLVWVGPRTTADDTVIDIRARGFPLRSIRRGICSALGGLNFVAGMITVLNPLPDIANHVIETETVGSE